MPGKEGLVPYKTVKTASRIEIVINRSRFIGRCFPITREKEALELLEKIRKEHWDASHNCYAYSIGVRGETARFSDDGEPGGTAGMPMMEAVKNIGVTDVLCIVTRYFGGVLLGAGGLVRAYSKSCSEAVRSAGIITMTPGSVYTFETPYNLWGLLQQIVQKFEADCTADYKEAVFCKVAVEKNKADAFLREITERSNGVLKGEFAGEIYFPREKE